VILEHGVRGGGCIVDGRNGVGQLRRWPRGGWWLLGRGLCLRRLCIFSLAYHSMYQDKDVLDSPSVVSLPAAARCKSLHCTRNSVLILLVASCSPSPLAPKRLSISSTKMILGANSFANTNNARTSFSDSPKNLLVKELALMAKKTLLLSVATALASIVFPVPGGPKRSIPLAGSLNPRKRSGRRKG